MSSDTTEFSPKYFLVAFTIVAARSEIRSYIYLRTLVLTEAAQKNPGTVSMETANGIRVSCRDSDAADICVPVCRIKCSSFEIAGEMGKCPSFSSCFLLEVFR